MKKIVKLTTIFTLCMCMFGTLAPMVTYAKEIDSNISNKNHEYTITELIEIVDPYIKETFNSYSIQNKEELISKIGLENYNLLEKRIEIATREKQELLSRDAVYDIHVQILRKAGATVEYHWWGKKIKTYSRTVAINVRKLANGFSGAAGTAGMKIALLAAGINFIPGLGAAATIAGAVVGVISWADSSTWSSVSSKVADKIDEGKYNLTIDINGWNMDVQVY
ncbi:MAG: hypothetical protein SPI53_01430 [Erysipelotrichaceae bacterium]|nr:hypothetical protein [Erysipelotrichaceae bacterium]